MKKITVSALFTLCLTVLAGPPVCADMTVTDYRGRQITLKKPAKKIIALAPHIVENLFAAGAGEAIVGAVDHCDYPEQAENIPRVGAISAYSLEAIIKLQPDLIVLWGSGRGADIQVKLEKLGFTVYVSDPRRLADVPRSIRDYGILTQNEKTAELSARAFERQHQDLIRKFANAEEVSTLYQVWDKPIQTLNDTHIISNVIRLCGGSNVFGDALALAPKISVESVIARDPDVIIASGMGEERPDWLDSWKQWQNLKAVKNSDLYYIPPDLIQRHTPRILQGAALMCEHLELSRAKKRH